MTAALWWTVQNTLTVAALAPAVWLACRCLRSRPAVQHLLWLLLLVKLVAPPIVDWPWKLTLAAQPTVRQAPLVEAVPHSVVAAPVNAEWIPDTEIDFHALDALAEADLDEALPVEPPAPTVTASTTPPFSELVLAAWSLGAVAMLAFTLRALDSQRSVLRASRPPSALLRAAIASAAMRLHVRPPRAAVSDRVDSPVVACLPRPKLIWPEALDEPDAIAASDGILAHELAHIARRDHLVVWFETLVLILHWWNPIAWYIRRRLRETRELACDALALAHAEQSRGDYARRLLDLSITRDRAPHFAPAFGAGTFSRRFLQRRLTMIFDSRTNGRLSAGGALLAALLAAVALPGFARAYQADNAPVAANTPVATSADAPPAPDAAPTAYVTTSDTVTVADAAPATTSSITVADAPSADNVSTASTNVGDDSAQKTGAQALSDLPLVGRLYATANTTDADPTRTTLTLDAAPVNTAQVVSLPHGGSMEILQQGKHLRLAIRQPDGTSQVIVYKLTNEDLSPNKASTYQPVADYVEGPAAATTAAAVPAPARRGGLSTEAVSAPAVAHGWTLATTEDIEMLKSDVELAEINYQEKKVEWDAIVSQNNSVPGAIPESKQKLAALAVRRAEIELKRSKLKLNRATSGPTTAPAATLDPNIQSN